ncbi:endothelin-converting enzyme 2-like isoform X2 [Dermacentor albipictus]|uniref:endothelin-converting enzyme 2-like isoform X2 n=1 Tax=Dermacentor albipictus TaxID=60249 RepID=UPI0038FD1227
MDAATSTRCSPPSTSSARTRMSTSSLVTPSLLSREHRALLHAVRLVNRSLACNAAGATSLARRERRPCLQITPLAVAAFVAGTALVALVLLFRGMVRRRLTARPPLRCGTADCLRHAFRLHSALNRSVDPCHDFGAFVCGSAGGDVPDVRDELWQQWSASVLQLLQTSHKRAGSAEAKMAAMLRSCLRIEPTGTFRENIVALRQFVDERRLAWPGTERENVHPLDVLLDLAINWQMPLWFGARVLLSGRASKRVIAVRLEPAPHPTARIGASRAGQICAVLDATAQMLQLSAETPRAPDHTPTSRRVPEDELAVELTALDHYIFDALAQVSSPLRHLPAVAESLRNVQNLTPIITASEWLTFLGRHLADVAANVTTTTQILTSNRGLLTTVSSFHEQFEHTGLLAHIARSLVATFANLFAGQKSKTSASDPVVSAANKASCLSQVEDAYGLVLAAHYARSRAYDRNSVDDLLNEIVRSAFALTSPASRRGVNARSRLEMLLVDLWPVFRDESLEALYEDFPDSGRTYFHYFVENRKSIRRKLLESSRNFANGVSVPSGWHFNYDVFSNRLAVAVGTVARPLFYAHGTRAMNFGGLGLLFARQLVGVIDAPDVHRGPQGWRVATDDGADAWNASRGHSEDVRALEIAFTALTNAVANDRDQGNQQERLVSLEDFTGDQLFFITACYNSCRWSSQRRMSVVCAGARRFDSFATAFGCSNGHTRGVVAASTIKPNATAVSGPA